MGIIIAIAVTLIIPLLRLYLNRPLSEEFRSKVLGKCSAEEFAVKYNKNGSYLTGGSLCFYGLWFGKPMDNVHRLVGTEYDKNTKSLNLTFHENEILTLHNPSIVNEYPNKIIIKDADLVKWQWYSYGKERTTENLYYIEITRVENKLKGISNFYSPHNLVADLSISKPALFWIEKV